MTYNAIYKCRLCGKEYVRRTTRSDSIALQNLMHMELDCPIPKQMGVPLNPTDTHYCDDGSFGYADFLGFRKDD